MDCRCWNRSPDSGMASHGSLDSHLWARTALVADLRRHPAPVAAAWARRRRSDAMTPSAFESALRLDGEVVVVALRGELDLASRPRADEQLRRAEALGAPALVIDLSELEFMDSNGATLLIQAHRRALAEGRRLALLNGAGEPHRVIELLGLQKLLRMVDDPRELVRSGGSGIQG
jgi:anti-sigma B factor antagonist